jgi:hypothetical protein
VTNDAGLLTWRVNSESVQHQKTPNRHDYYVSFKTRGGSRIGTVELQHPQLPLDIIDNI